MAVTPSHLTECPRCGGVGMHTESDHYGKYEICVFCGHTKDIPTHRPVFEWKHGKLTPSMRRVWNPSARREPAADEKPASTPNLKERLRELRNQRIIDLRRAGFTYQRIGEMVGCCEETVGAVLRAAGLSGRLPPHPEQVETIQNLYRDGLSYSEISRRLGVDRRHVSRSVSDDMKRARREEPTRRLNLSMTARKFQFIEAAAARAGLKPTEYIRQAVDERMERDIAKWMAA